jgi:hypothetical protein
MIKFLWQHALGIGLEEKDAASAEFHSEHFKNLVYLKSEVFSSIQTPMPARTGDLFCSRDFPKRRVI